MTSTVPGAITGKSLVQAAVGAQAPDLSGLSAKTIQLSPEAPLRSAIGRQTSVETFGAALARAIAAKKAAGSASNASAVGRQAAARTGSPRAELATARDPGQVREVTRQLKQLVGAVREALGPRKPSGSGLAAPQAQLAASGQNVIQQQDQAALSPADAEALRGVFARVVGMNADRQGGSEDHVPLSAQQEAGAEALLQTVADSLAQAMGGDGEIDEGTLASALESDPLALAAAESLIAAAQAQGLIPVTVPVALVEGSAGPDGAQDADGAVPAAQLGASAPAAADPAATASAGVTDAAGAAPIDLVAASTAATSAATAGTVDAAAAVTVERTGVSTASGQAAQATVDSTADGAASRAAISGADASASEVSLLDTQLDTQNATPATPNGPALQAFATGATVSAESLNASASAAESLAGATVATTAGDTALEGATTQDPQTPALSALPDPAATLGAASGAAEAVSDAATDAAPAVLSVVAEAAVDAASPLAGGEPAGTPETSSSAPVLPAQGPALAQAASAAVEDGALSAASGDAVESAVSSVAGTSSVSAQAGAGEAESAGSGTGQATSGTQSGQATQATQAGQGGQAGETAGTPQPIAQPIAQSGQAGAAPRAAGAQVAQAAGEAGEVQAYDLHDQVAPVIVRQARLVNVGGAQELTVRLNPDHLGPLHVRISLAEGALTVGLTAANSEAHRALESALPQLRGALVDAGLRLDRVDVAFRDAGSSGNGSGQRGGFTGRGNDGQPGAQNGDSGRFARQFGAGSGGPQEDAPSFADVLFDQDGRAFPVRRADSATANAGYRAYGASRARRRY